MYIYVLFNILVTFKFIILVFSELWAILLTIKNEKHVKSSDSDVCNAKVIDAKRVKQRNNSE